jgi:hypothetical protein
MDNRIPAEVNSAEIVLLKYMHESKEFLLRLSLHTKARISLLKSLETSLQISQHKLLESWFIRISAEINSLKHFFTKS